MISRYIKRAKNVKQKEGLHILIKKVVRYFFKRIPYLPKFVKKLYYKKEVSTWKKYYNSSLSEEK